MRAVPYQDNFPNPMIDDLHISTETMTPGTTCEVMHQDNFPNSMFDELHVLNEPMTPIELSAPCGPRDGLEGGTDSVLGGTFSQPRRTDREPWSERTGANEDWAVNFAVGTPSASWNNHLEPFCHDDHYCKPGQCHCHNHLEPLRDLDQYCQPGQCHYHNQYCNHDIRSHVHSGQLSYSQSQNFANPSYSVFYDASQDYRLRDWSASSLELPVESEGETSHAARSKQKANFSSYHRPSAGPSQPAQKVRSSGKKRLFTKNRQ